MAAEAAKRTPWDGCYFECWGGQHHPLLHIEIVVALRNSPDFPASPFGPDTFAPTPVNPRRSGRCIESACCHVSHASLPLHENVEDWRIYKCVLAAVQVGLIEGEGSEPLSQGLANGVNCVTKPQD